MLRLFYCFGVLSFFFLCSLHSQLPLKPPPVLTKTELIRSAYRKEVKTHEIVKPPLLIKKAFIILDPGHGGQDTGTQSISKPRYQEKSLNLITAQFVKTYLQELGYQVLMTRETDVFVSLEKRAQWANKQKPDLFISIHYNAALNAEAQGLEVFYYPSKEKRIRMHRSKKLAQKILKNILKQTKATSRGVKEGNYAVIRETYMPAILIEGGFITNEKELQKLKDPYYLKQLSWGIVKGIDEYLNK